jgi:hypothetical protein
MILEGIVTTLNSDGSVNIAPMGPRVDDAMRSFVLTPFRTSTTYQNLKRHGEGVLHVTDDAWLFAQAAVGQPDPPPRLVDASAVRGSILADACRWYAFRVTRLDDRADRTRILAEVVDRGEVRPFFGFNRGKHAVVEAAILATRVHLLPPDEILAQLELLRPLVEKTGGERERAAFQFLEAHIRACSPKEYDGR